MKSENRIWYKKSADDFDSALPVGNGRMGAMVYGRAIDEIISLNEDSIWSGGLRNRNNPDAYNGMMQVRKLIDEGNLKEAEQIAFYKMQGISSNSRSYMPLGNLFIHMQNFGKVREYTRELDLQRAIITTSYSLGGVKYLRQVFTSYPDNVMVVHFYSEEEGKISFTANLDGREGLYDDNRPCSENTIMYTGGSGGENGINFAVYMTATAVGGTVETLGSKLVVTDANEATILISVGSSFYGEMYKESALMDLEYASECDYGELMYRHIEDYSALYNRVEFELEDSEDYVYQLPTNERLERLHGSEFDDKECIRDISDPGFITLFYNYSRYLMISSSRPNSQPMNLQGLWNEDMRPRWGSRYTINVNTEMAYWPSEICNLSECHLPLFDLLERVRENGRVTAQEMYHCRGFVAHDNTDIWGDTAPQGMYVNSTLWPMGAAWLSLHIFEHYRFTGDIDFLREKFETMKEAALFFVDFLVEDEEGRLITTPTVSPENSYKNEQGNTGSICKGATMDSQIIRALFKDVCQASEILDEDRDFAKKLEKMIEKLPETQIGKYGQIQEWSHDYDEVEVGHRHVSQLFGLFPGNEISQIKTPKLANAARATLIRRLIYKDGHFGWNYAWTMNMWARLFDGQMAYENLQKMFLYSLSPNMLNNYPPFQIDANMGIAAGITEMLMQSSDGEINLLPALPDNWKSGRIKGIKARGGFEVTIIWKDLKLEKAEITSLLGNECRIRYKNPISVESYKESICPRVENDLICFETQKDKKYIIKG
jgi:alpha-L-fucosidase 2